MGMMGMFKWLRKDLVSKDRSGWNTVLKQSSFNNESYRNALQAFIDRRRLVDDALVDEAPPRSPDKIRADLLTTNNNNKHLHNNNNNFENDWKLQDSKSNGHIAPGVPHIRPSEIFEIGWVAGTEDRYLEMIFAEWHNTRVSLKRHTHPECKNAVKADLDVLSEIRHPNVLLLMATTYTDEHGLVTIFESVDCTLYNYIHEQGERLSVQGIAKCGGRLSDALRHSHMRGFVHGAISSHCVYLSSSGIIKLGGWELAYDIKHSKPSQEFTERLRDETYRWQAPELFYGFMPRVESDVYGLALLIWEISTTHIPWSGFSKIDVEKEYIYWKRGICADLYNFPPLLNNLLGAGLQLDVTKRTIDMNRMGRFLQRLEMQYEDVGPVYLDESANNNVDTTNKTYVVPIIRSPSGLLKKGSSLTKSASAKQLSRKMRNFESSQKHLSSAKKTAPKNIRNSWSSLCTDRSDFFTDDVKHNNAGQVKKNGSTRCSVSGNLENTTYGSCKPEIFDSRRDDESNFSDALHPWQNTYRKVFAPNKIIESASTITSVQSNSSAPLDLSDEDSYKDARTSLRELKEELANKREHFFYGSDTSQSSPDSNRNIKNTILIEARNKDYEPHKPASHKTSFEPKYNKSPGQYSPNYSKPLFKECRKIPYLHTPEYVKDAVIQPQVLNPDTESFFETSLWRKEKLICLSKMRKPQEDEPTSFCTQDSENKCTNDTMDTVSSNPYPEFQSSKDTDTYLIDEKSKTSNLDTYQEESVQNISDVQSDDVEQSTRAECKSMQVLKNALDRATKIVYSFTPTPDETSQFSTQFGSYEDFPESEDDIQARRSVFEELYDLQAKENEEIQSIERSMKGDETFLLSSNNRANDKITYERKPVYLNNTSCTRTFVSHPDSITEITSELDDSRKSMSLGTIEKSVLDEEDKNDTGTPVETNIEDRKSIVKNYTLMLLNETQKIKDCNTCKKSALPRRRSLPAALSNFGGHNSSASILGKLPIRRGGIPDNTVEDLYIDDEFGDSLNVNMILLEDELSLDEDFLPDMSEL